MEGSKMSERTVCIPLSILGDISKPLYAELGRVDEIAWVSMSDSTLIEIKERHHGVALIYYSVGEFENAIRDLSASEVDEVIRKRLDEWAPAATRDFLDRVYRLEQRCLTLTALGHCGSTGAARGALEKHFEETLNLLNRILGEGRYDRGGLSSLLLFALEREVILIDEIEVASSELGEAGDTALVSSLSAEKKTRERNAEEYGLALKQHGRPEFVGSPPYVALLRILLVSPRDKELMAALAGRRQPFVEWKDGVVAAWRVRDIRHLEERGKSAVLLYRDPGVFQSDMESLTTAQLRREFDNRLLSNQRRLRESITEHLNALRLGDLLLKKSLIDVARKQDPVLAQTLEEQVARETIALRTALSSDTTWLTDPPADGGGAITRLRETEQQIVRDVTLFGEICRLTGDAGLRSELLSLLRVKKEHLAQVESLAANARPGSQEERD
jgi:hypothetical protein